ncbi:hypothetical protein ACES2J_06135 [Bdellovibrio bacteriovorus]|uniref:hypothetical protein n=1 Tax=Bdellovibrio bacteriovorus TaxID=959 RepID=UPI0035A6FB99
MQLYLLAVLQSRVNLSLITPVQVVPAVIPGFLVDFEEEARTQEAIKTIEILGNELFAAIKKCANFKTVRKLLYDFIVTDLIGTLIGGTIGSLWTIVRHPLKTLKNLLSAIKDFALAVWRGEKDALLKLICFGISFVVGVPLGLAVPDLDIKGFGIGSHRNILTHSVVPMLAIEALKLFLIRVGKVIYASLPPNHHPIWESIATGSRSALEGLTKGIQTGIAAHLLKDAFLDGSQNIRTPDGTSLLSKKHILDKGWLFEKGRELTPSDIFLTLNSGGTLIFATKPRH